MSSLVLAVIKPMKVYLAGPMRNYAHFNFPAFHAATEQLRELGHSVFSPAERDNDTGFDPTGMKGDHAELVPAGFNLFEALCADLTFICLEADAVVVLPGWEESKGSQAEVATAKALDKPVFTLEEMGINGTQENSNGRTPTADAIPEDST